MDNSRSPCEYWDLSQQILSYIHYISGAHGDKQVSGTAVFFQKCFDFFKTREIVGICAEFSTLRCQIGRGNSQRVSLPCRIDICKDEMIRMGERFCKFMEKCFRAGVRMRLEDAPYRIVRIVLRSL